MTFHNAETEHELGGQHDVLYGCEVGKEIELLKNHADAAADFLGIGGIRGDGQFTVVDNLSFLVLLEAVHAAQEC